VDVGMMSCGFASWHASQHATCLDTFYSIIPTSLLRSFFLTCYILPKATCYTKKSWSKGPDVCS